MFEVLMACTKGFVPFLLFIIPLCAYARRVPLLTSFAEGAKEAIPTILTIIPNLVAMMVAVAVFRASGALELVLDFISPWLEQWSIPREVVPIGLLRPLSGAGSLAFVEDVLRNYGPDSFLGILASTIQGSTDTTLYVITVYFGAMSIRKARYALKVGLIADAVGFLSSLVICHWWFR